MSVFHAEVGGRLFMLENEDLCMRCAVKKKLWCRVCTQTLNSKSLVSKVPLAHTDRPLPSDCTYWPSFLPSSHTPPPTLHMHTYTPAQDSSLLLVMWGWSVYLSVPLAECSCTSSKTPWHGGSSTGNRTQRMKDIKNCSRRCVCVFVCLD